LVVLSLVIAMPTAWLLARKWLEDYPYRIEIGWTLFATASFIVLGIALATVSIQAVKAAVANPTKSLRSE
jgi:putative ABC transport system permease protein